MQLKMKDGAFTQKQRKERLASQIERLTCINDIFSGSQQALASRLIEDIAFMTATMDEAKSIITSKGIVEEYKNGENQWGYKKSSAVETYDKLANSRLRCIKQLADMLPETTLGDSPADMLRAFISGD